MRILLVPDTGTGHGSAHLRRQLRLLDLIADSSILLPADRARIASLIADVPTHRTVHSLSGEWDLIVVDRFRADREEVLRYLAHGCTVGVDLGGPGRGLCDYLIDALPRLDRSAANLSDDAFLDLEPPAPSPEGRRLLQGRSIVVSFGGEDPARLTEPVSRLLDSAGLGERTVAVVPGMRTTGEIPPAVLSLPPQPSLAPLLAEASVVVTSYGMTAYEARIAGACVVTVAPTRYHDRLARAAGFARAGVRQPSRRLAALVARLAETTDDGPAVTPRATQAATQAATPRATQAVAPRRRALDRAVTGLVPPVRRGCPAHPGSFGAALWRSEEKSYFVCPVCGLVYLERFVGDEETYGAEYFMDEYRAQYGKTYLEDFEHIRRMGTRRLDSIHAVSDGAAHTVLDVGCAYGPFLAAADDRGMQAYGLDVAGEAVRYVAQELSLPAVRAGILDFDPRAAFGVDQFDVVTLWYVVEHFAELDQVLRKVSGLVRPGGVLALGTPHGGGVSAKRNPAEFYANSPRDHYTIWNRRSARRVLREHGLRVRRFVVTGHHPERYPSVRAGRVPAGVAGLHSRLAGRGDTFEIYARKEAT